jgi:hypothetical protein
LVCFAFGWQLPFSPADFPGVGSYPGQQVCELDGLRPLSLLLLFLADVFFALDPVWDCALFFIEVAMLI